MNASRSLLMVALAVLPLSVGNLGCDAAKKGAAQDPKSPATAFHGSTSAPTLTSAGMPPPGVDASVETNGLHVSDAIARACGLAQLSTTTSFEFDSSAIGDDDRGMLAQIAKCLTEGALRGKS